MIIGNESQKVNKPRHQAGKELPHVNRFTDRHGKVRRYFRRPGHPAVALPGEPDSVEFLTAYLAEMRKVEPVAIGEAKRSKAGTISAAIAAYYQSNQYFLEPLSDGTQRTRRGILERFRAQDGHRLLSDLRRGDIIARLDLLLPSTRRNALVALRGLMQYAVAVELIKEDPTTGLKGYKPPAKAADDDSEDGHQTWPEAWVAQYEAHHPIGSTARLAMALPLYTAQRISDVFRMGPGMVKAGIMTLRQQKTGALVHIPVEPALAHTIAASVCGLKTYIISNRGKGYSHPGGLGAAFGTWCDAAGLPPEATMHGLRKAWCRRAAGGGASEDAMMAVTGHKSSKELRRYLAMINREMLAHQGIAAAAKGARAEQQQNTIAKGVASCRA
jgi:integrase